MWNIMEETIQVPNNNDFASKVTPQTKTLLSINTD